MNKLKLKNPLIFFDLETTGIDVVKDRIVELSYLKVYPDGKEETRTWLINPGMPIPPESTAIHGISDNDVKDAPAFQQVAQKLANEFEGCDFAGFNSNKFDIPLLAEEFLRTNVDFDMKKRKFIDVMIIFMKMEQRNLGAAYRFYCNRELDDAHSAEADTRATYEILQAQIDRYGDLENDVDMLSAFSSHNRNVDYMGRIVYNDNDVEVINFGKYKGVPVEEVLEKDPGYYSWIMNADFPQYTKKVLTNIKLRKFNK
ncbi:MAG: 3'-5' exonuclease [Marinilabiliales bacterium]|nr:MAG: 3'-5' exonuclease [Marinilabiliales bacterium]